MDAGTSQEMVFHEAALHSGGQNSRGLKPQFTAFTPFNLFIMHTTSHPQTGFSACKVCTREEFVPKV